MSYYHTQPDGEGCPERVLIRDDEDAWPRTEQDWLEILAGAEDDAEAAHGRVILARVDYNRAFDLETAALEAVLRLRKRVAEMAGQHQTRNQE